MQRSTVRKVIRAASLSLLLAMATSVAGLEIVGASPAMAEPDAGSNPAQGSTPDPAGSATPGDPTKPADPAKPSDPGLGGIVGNPGSIIGGLGGVGGVAP